MLKLRDIGWDDTKIVAAAFRRLCVETATLLGAKQFKGQPPSGGCVLKPNTPRLNVGFAGQPPSGGCVLKLKQET